MLLPPSYGQNSILPNPSDAKRVQPRISAEYRYVTRKRLGSNHAIERITMLGSEPSGTERTLYINGKPRITGVIDNLQEVSFKPFCSRKLSETYFSRNLPGRCRRHENHLELICDDRRCFSAEERGRKSCP
jgi:hypothetical protein